MPLILPRRVVDEIKREKNPPPTEPERQWNQRSFHVAYHSDLVKFVNLVNEADGRILTVANRGDNLLSGSYDIEYLCDRDIEMGVLC